MKSEVVISVNQLAEFIKASNKKKVSIVKQQKNPVAVKIARYNLAKARMRKFISTKGDLSPLFEGLNDLNSKNPTTNWQANDKKVSIEALERFIEMKLPSLLSSLDDYQILKKLEIKSFKFSGINIIVSPDLIIQGTIGGKTYIGAVKIHVSKSSPFDAYQSKYVSTCIYKYLIANMKSENIIIIPELCFCVDVFGGTIMAAPNYTSRIDNVLKGFCSEIIKIWDAA